MIKRISSQSGWKCCWKRYDVCDGPVGTHKVPHLGPLPRYPVPEGHKPTSGQLSPGPGPWGAWLLVALPLTILQSCFWLEPHHRHASALPQALPWSSLPSRTGWASEVNPTAALCMVQGRDAARAALGPPLASGSPSRGPAPLLLLPTSMQ